MIGQDIVASANPQGKFEEVIISGTPLPGTFMEIVPSSAMVGGRFTMRNVTRANGAIGPVCILRADSLQGKMPTDAYVSGTRGFVYWPVAGEYLNALISESVGTGTAGETNVGDRLAIQQDSGQLMAGGSLASRPFSLIERTGNDGKVDTIKLVQYLGNSA